jgi:RNA polymerase subunit RPABC4/transcription elongation factor Spt4
MADAKQEVLKEIKGVKTYKTTGPGYKACKECKTIVGSGTRVCPKCDTAFPKRKKPRIVLAELSAEEVKDIIEQLEAMKKLMSAFSGA